MMRQKELYRRLHYLAHHTFKVDSYLKSRQGHKNIPWRIWHLIALWISLYNKNEAKHNKNNNNDKTLHNNNNNNNNNNNICESWIHRVPPSTTTKERATISWYTPLLTDKMVKFNKPNIVIHNATEHTAQLIDVKSPQDYNVVSASTNNIKKLKYL